MRPRGGGWVGMPLYEAAYGNGKLRSMKVRIPRLHCRRCGHRWVPKQPVITMCARCKSRYWNEPRRNRQGMRPEPKADRQRAGKARRRP